MKAAVSRLFLTYACGEIRRREQLLERDTSRDAATRTQAKSRQRCVVAVACKVENWCTYMMVFFVVKDVGDRASSRRVREPRGPWSDDGVGIYGRPAAFRIPDSCKLALPTRRVVCFEKFIADDLARWRVEGPGSRGFSIINRCQYAGIDHHSHLDRHTTIGSFFLENVFPLRKR